jgi:hypothetical protein
MPKEITHWIVGIETAAALRETILGDAALNNINILKFGAIFPDILFNLPDTRKMARYRNISHSLHGANGEDTYDQIRHFTTSIQENPCNRQFLAFLLGVLTHIKTDMVFHPMVYYLTGNLMHPDPSIRSEAIQQHRRFESLVDLYFCRESKDVKKYTIKPILKDLEIPASRIIELSLQGIGLNATLPDIHNIFVRALNNFRILQKCYRCRPLARFLCSMAPFLSKPAREFIALFYPPQLDRMLPRVSGAISYMNPITGDIENSRLDDLLEEAVRQSVMLARIIEKKITDGPTSSFVERGPSLSYGVPGATDNQAIYFADKPFFGQDRL